MVSSTVRVRKNADAAAALESASDTHLLDVAQAGQNAALETIHDEATDTGQLSKSAFGPERQPDGSVTFGWSAGYAEYVNDGTRPHWPPIGPLLGWARRVLGDESAAYAVQRKIAQEGTEGVGFIRDAMDAMRAYAASHDLGDLFADRL